MCYRVTSIKTGYDRKIAAIGRLQPKTDTQVPDSIGLLTIQEKVVLQYLQTNKVVKSGTVEQFLHIEARARRLLKQMRERGLIVKVGKARNTYYVLGDTFKIKDDNA